MKKIVLAAALVLMMMAMTACGNNKNNSATEPAKESRPATTPIPLLHHRKQRMTMETMITMGQMMPWMEQQMVSMMQWMEQQMG